MSCVLPTLNVIQKPHTAATEQIKSLKCSITRSKVSVFFIIIISFLSLFSSLAANNKLLLQSASMAVCSPHNRLINKPPIDSLCWRTLRRIKWGTLFGLKFEMKFFLILHLSTSFAVGRRSLAWWIFFNFYYYLFSYIYPPCPSLLSSEKVHIDMPRLAWDRYFV